MSLWQRIWEKILSLFREERILCDSCAYDWGNACTRPERPNAVKCPDYKPRGR